LFTVEVAVLNHAQRSESNAEQTFARKYFYLLSTVCYHTLNNGSVEATCVVGDKVITVNIPYHPIFEYEWYKDSAKSKMQVELLQYLFEQEVKSLADKVHQE
jgi:hypothetical protein